MEGCAALLERMISADDGKAEALRIVAGHRAARTPIPGFGHHLHKPDDPRSLRLFDIARDEGLAGAHIKALQTLAQTVDEGYGKHITINATGAIAAALGDCGVPADIMRGFAIITRCAGLVGHIHEEQRKPALRAIWEASEQAVPYDGPIGN
jgi:citrate synthase